MIPETKGLSLEHMDDLFGVTELVKNIEEEGRGEHVHAPPTKIGFGGKETSKATHKENVNELGDGESKGEAKGGRAMGGDAVVGWGWSRTSIFKGRSGDNLGFEEFKVGYLAFEIY